MSTLEGIVQDSAQFFVSQSEVDSFLACERKHWYAFGKEHPKYPGTNGLQPVTHSVSLTRGTVGHKVLEDYYQALKDGRGFDGAFLYARDLHIKAMGENPEHAEIYTEILNTFTSYVKHYANEDYEPLVMEHEFRLELPNNTVFPFKPDAIFKERSTGKIFVVDHKFLYRFYQDRVFGILPQMLRYTKALTELGYPVAGTLYNMLSTDKRAQPAKRFKRHPQELTPGIVAKMNTLWNEMLSVQQQIVKFKSMPKAQWEQSVRRNASSFSCANCPFLELCTAELEQQNGINLLVGSFYESNKYGYGREKEIEE